jgi:hypothetical protein
MKLEFSLKISKNPQIWNSMRIRPVGAQFFVKKERTDGRTDRYDEGNSQYSKFF